MEAIVFVSVGLVIGGLLILAIGPVILDERDYPGPYGRGIKRPSGVQGGSGYDQEERAGK